MKTQTQFPRGENGVTSGSGFDLPGAGSLRKGADDAVITSDSAPGSRGLRPVLSVDERARLADLEGVIRRGLDSFLEVGEALLEVRKDRLYREVAPTFESYCEKQWSMTARRARQLCSATAVVENLRLPENGSAAVLPATESQARPLSRLPEEEQKPAWDRAVRKAELMGSPVTAKIVESVVQEKMEAKKPKPDVLPQEDTEGAEGEGWPKSNKDGVYRDSDAETVRFKRERAHVEIRLLQISQERWTAATDYDLPDTGEGSPLKVGGLLFTTRAEALRSEAESLVSSMARLLKGTGSKIQKAMASAVHEWAVGLVEINEPPVNLPRENAKGAEESEWPKPNQGGLYSEVGSDVIRFFHPLATAQVSILQVGKYDWISCWAYEFKTGTRQYRSLNLRREPGLQITDREAAVIHGLKELRKMAEIIVQAPEHAGLSEKQRIAAGLISKWCATQLKGSGVVLKDEKEKPSRNKPAEQFSMVAERAGHLSAGIRLYVKTIRELPGGMAERFGQAVYHLDCARTELDRLALGGKAAAVAPSRPREKVESGNEEYVVCRKPRKDVVGDAPKFWAGPMAWTIRPEKAKHLSKEEAEGRLDKTGKWESCANDVAMPLIEAIDLVVKTERKKALGRNRNQQVENRAITLSARARARWNLAKAKGKAAKKGAR